MTLVINGISLKSGGLETLLEVEPASVEKTSVVPAAGALYLFLLYYPPTISNYLKINTGSVCSCLYFKTSEKNCLERNYHQQNSLSGDDLKTSKSWAWQLTPQFPPSALKAKNL
jgi:hypothetical protein